MSLYLYFEYSEYLAPTNRYRVEELKACLQSLSEEENIKQDLVTENLKREALRLLQVYFAII